MEDYKYLIPEESEDASSLDTSLLRSIENDLRDIFQKYTYTELMLPSFEYVDLYQGIRTQGEESMFQFVNSEGKHIALRTDFTVPIARLYNNMSTDEVKRYSYFGKVYRTIERHKGRSSELYQVGVELIGLEGIKGDQECLNIVEETMSCIPLHDLKLELGSARFYKRLMSLVKDQNLSMILDKKAVSEMEKFVSRKHIDGDLKDVLLKLPTSFGDIKDLQTFKKIVKDEELLSSIEDLEKLYELSSYKDNMVFDLCMVPTQRYYTGIMMKGYSYYSAYPILSGGRYDNLLNYFDNDIPAVGFSYHMNTLLQAISKEGEVNA